MEILPKKELSRRWRDVRIADVATLLHNVLVGISREDVGFEDAAHTADDLLKRMNKRVLLDPRLLESALWACNLLDEKESFWDPRGRTFDEFLASVLGSASKFDKRYNYINGDE